MKHISHLKQAEQSTCTTEIDDYVHELRFTIVLLIDYFSFHDCIPFQLDKRNATTSTTTKQIYETRWALMLWRRAKKIV